MGCLNVSLLILLSLWSTALTIALIIFGAKVLNNESQGINRFTDFSVGAFAIAVAIIPVIIGSCCRCFTKFVCFAAFCFVAIIILEVVLGATALASVNNNDGQLDKVTKEAVEKVFDDYKNQPTDHKLEVIDKIQAYFECCGVESVTYWETSDKPSSCIPDGSFHPYEDGCLDKFQNMITSNITTVGIIAIAMAVVNVLMVIFSYMYYKEQIREIEGDTTINNLLVLNRLKQQI